MVELEPLLRIAAERKASDLFIKENSPPAMRLNGRIQVSDGPPLTADDTRRLAYSILTHEQIGRFEHRHEMDIAFTIEGVTRIRANVHMQRGSIGLVCRLVPLKIYSLEQLGMPPVLAEVTKSRSGLI